MGKDKFENEELISYGLPIDIWFHVDKLSSAHVYLRLPEGQSIEDVSEELIVECCQLCKANSIDGCKKANLSIVYTPWSNLKKTAGMAVGQIGFHNSKKVKKFLVEKKINAIVNRLNKTKEERNPDLRAEQIAYGEEQQQKEKVALKLKHDAEAKDEQDRKEQKEARSYDNLMASDNMSTNEYGEDVNFQDVEDDFM